LRTVLANLTKSPSFKKISFYPSGGNEMKKRYNWLCTLILATTTLGLVGCNAGTPVPTADPKLIYTQAAQTVQARTTGDAKLTPFVTNTPKPTEPLAATPTLRPSSTMMGTPPTQGPTLPGQKSPTPGTPIVLPTTAPTAIPTLDATQSAASSGDKGIYVSQTVADGSTVSPSQKFTIVWTLKNTGTTTWDPNYLVRLFGGNSFGFSDSKLDKTVKPGANTTITMELTAPATTGEYSTVWVLTNLDGRNFTSFVLTIKVK
jgi:hypothetical protein